MRSRGPGHWGSSARGPGGHIGFRVFGFLFFLLFMSAVVGGIIAWLVAPGNGLFLAIGFLVIVAFGLAMRRVFRRAWGPVSDLIDATTRLGEGDTSVRMERRRSGPWDPVTRSFNNMAERLQQEDEQRRRLLADLGHELRTPMTVIRGEIEAVLDGVHPPESLRNVVDEIALMDRLLEDLKTLALTEAGVLKLDRQPTDIGELVNDVVASFAATTELAGIETSVKTKGELVCNVDPHRIHQVVANLVSNAVIHMPEGGMLEVEVLEETIVVRDTGPGIPHRALPHVFDRFSKTADSPGSGLGLSIVRDLVEAHGGQVTASNRDRGGAEFRVELG